MYKGEKQSESIVGKNVTFDPLAAALPVDHPAIFEVLDCDTGEFVVVRDWIGTQRYETVVAARVNVRERLLLRPHFRCWLCGVPVYLVCNQFKHFFFRHTAEDGSCPAETRHPLSRDDILARKYHGLRESEPHRRIKALIMRSLEADASFSDVRSEHQWRSSHDPRDRRQPDVQATSASGRIAFEVQLSTTFLDVVAGRRSFYRQEGATLVWIMGRFDPTYRRLTTDDILFSNNSNIILVDEETTALSESARRFHVRCHYRRPVRQSDLLADQWETCVVPFSALTCERESQRCWYFDYERHSAAIRIEIQTDLQERERIIEDSLRSELFSFWVRRKVAIPADDEARGAWAKMRDTLHSRGIPLPASPDDDSGFIALMNGVVSAKEGRPVGWGFRQLVEIAHRIAEGYPRYIVAFAHAVRLFEREGMINKQDRSKKWERRRAAIRTSLLKGEPDFKPDLQSIPLVDFLMPGMKQKLEKIACAEAPSHQPAASPSFAIMS